ncbi:hypothetical protein H0X10_00680, partial [Candidatus Saccharibacteria bacterium]|nr:hypothetical protein [Candidatus Saccharibacteria bacterium]
AETEANPRTIENVGATEILFIGTLAVAGIGGSIALQRDKNRKRALSSSKK